MRVRVVDPGRGLGVTLGVEPDARGSALKEEACSALGLVPESYVLVRGGRALDEGASLLEEGVSDGDRLVLILRGVWEALRGEARGRRG